jgi:heat shock protein HslJ
LSLWLALSVGCFAAAWPGVAAQGDFPFDHELFLDADPLRGLKRVPILEIAANGDASIDLWCSSGQGQASVSGETIRIVPGPMVERLCTPEGVTRDQELLADLGAVTTWRREGDRVLLIGSRTLRFRLATN